MRSCDTNILLYALNSDCPEHLAARSYLQQQGSRDGFAICELVLTELYVLLRNPAVIKRPYRAAEAVAVIQRFRSNPRWAVIDYPGNLMEQVWERAGKPHFARRAIIDARLALTLRHHGVQEFATRNTSDFEGYGFAEVVNPID